MQRTGWFANLADLGGVFSWPADGPFSAATAGVIADRAGIDVSDDPGGSQHAFAAFLLHRVFLLARQRGSPGGRGTWPRLARSRPRRSLIFAGATAALGVTALVAVETYIVVTTAPPTQAALADRLITGDVTARRAAARKLALEHKAELLPVFIQAGGGPRRQGSPIRDQCDWRHRPAGSSRRSHADRRAERSAGRTAGKLRRKASGQQSQCGSGSVGQYWPGGEGRDSRPSPRPQGRKHPRATLVGNLARGNGFRGRIPPCPLLIAALADPDPQVRRYAIQSLQKIGPSQDITPSLPTPFTMRIRLCENAAAALLKSLGTSH